MPQWWIITFFVKGSFTPSLPLSHSMPSVAMAASPAWRKQGRNLTSAGFLRYGQTCFLLLFLSLQPVRAFLAPSICPFVVENGTTKIIQHSSRKMKRKRFNHLGLLLQHSWGAQNWLGHVGITIPLIMGTVLNHCRIRILGSRFFHCSVKNIWGSWNQISLKAFVALLRLPDLEALGFEEGPTATIWIFSVKPCQGILFPSRRVCLCINSSCQLRSSLCSGIGQVGVGP